MTSPTSSPTFSALTTLRVGGPIADYREVDSEAQLIETIREADAQQSPLLVLGEGSNLVANDEPFEGIVVRDTRAEVRIDQVDSCGGGNVTVTAGHNWDQLVQRAIAEEWVGLEALSGIPGTVGAAPVQNIGAYGQEISNTIASVRTWDRHESRIRTMTLFELRFGYRTSVLKRSTLPDADFPSGWFPSPRYIVLDVSFQFRLGTRSIPVGYSELARELGVELGQRTHVEQVRQAVLKLRASKGMVLDESDHDTWSAGSFFTNPILKAEAADRLPTGAPRYPVASALPTITTGPASGGVNPDLVKTSAAWLIEQAGFSKGFALPGSAAALSSKHVLALTNRGGATAEQVRELALAVRAGVRESFGIKLIAEPVLFNRLP